jgi:hypothetical protein
VVTWMEPATDQAVAACAGDLRATVRALIAAVEFLEAETEGQVSPSFRRGVKFGRFNTYSIPVAQCFCLMREACSLVWSVLVLLFRSRASLEAEILILRHQLNIQRRHLRKRLTFSATDRACSLLGCIV